MSQESKTVKVTFMCEDSNKQNVTNTENTSKKKEISVDAKLGDTILQVIRKNKDNGLDIEAACNGSLACSTCHVYIPNKEDFAKFPEAEEEEEDLLNLALNPNNTSRLCCQLVVTEKIDGVKIHIPEGTCNIDGS